MDKKTLTGLFAESLYQIPDYQRGYAWEEKQWKDFIQDIDALVDEEVRSHYTGTIVVYASRDMTLRDYGTKRLKVVDVVDGQQRLTTACLYLSVIIRALINSGEKDYERDIADFLYTGTACRLSLNNETADLFYELLKTGRANTPPQTPHAQRLLDACARFQRHIDAQLSTRPDGLEYLKGLYYAITTKMHFTHYAIEEECEIGMTFELMNSRGKDLSVLELLKNYLMHWVSRNIEDPTERDTLTDRINKSWKSVYTNLGACSGAEDQCLRIAWTLLCNYSPSNWKGYDGFKDDDYIPLRNFNKRSREDVIRFITAFTERLAELSCYYATIVSPTRRNTRTALEYEWLVKIHHSGNIANFLPLIVAARKHWEDGNVTEADYIALLKALECYAYRVFLFEGRRSNAGISTLFRWGYQIFTQSAKIADVTSQIYGLTRFYAPEETFIEAMTKPGNWYASRNRLKYTLFEYELHLLATEGQGKPPLLQWEDLRDSTIEHILPQNPDENSRWRKAWKADAMAACMHDIGNLVLTQDNASYSNFEFARKKGKPGKGPSYSNSDIRQERKISSYDRWTYKEFMARREELVAWITARWKTETAPNAPSPVLFVDEEDEGTEQPVQVVEV